MSISTDYFDRNKSLIREIVSIQPLKVVFSRIKVMVSRFLWDYYTRQSFRTDDSPVYVMSEILPGALRTEDDKYETTLGSENSRPICHWT